MQRFLLALLSLATAALAQSAWAVPAESGALADEAKACFERGDYRAAEKIYESLAKQHPQNVQMLSNLGVTRFRLQKYRLAEEALRQATVAAPQDDFCHCMLGIVHYQLQRFDDAIQSLTRALAINSGNATAHHYLGLAAKQKGWQDAAKKELELAKRLDPNYADLPKLNDAHPQVTVPEKMEKPVPDAPPFRLELDRPIKDPFLTHNDASLVIPSPPDEPSAALMPGLRRLLVTPGKPFDLPPSPRVRIGPRPYQGDVLTPLERSRLTIPPHDRVRE